MAKRRVTIDDQLSFKRVADAQISPDGSMVVFQMGDSYIENTKNQRSNLWMVPAEGGEPRRVTSSNRSDVKPRWSPDGQHLAFLSDRAEDGQYQVYLLPANGGEAVQITDTEGSFPTQGGVPTIEWSPDGSKLAYIKYDPETEDEKRRKAEKRDVVEFEQHPKFLRIYVIDVETRELTCASPDGLQIWDYCWSPDGAHFAAVASDLPFEADWYLNRLVRFPVGGGKVDTLYDTDRMVSKPTWSPDGGTIAFTSSTWSDKYSVKGDVWVVPAGGGEYRDLTEGEVASYCWIQWSDDSSKLLVSGDVRGGPGITEIDVNSGENRPLWHGEGSMAEGNYAAFSSDSSGNLAFVLESWNSPRQVYLAEPSNGSYELTQLTDLHPEAADLEIGRVEEIFWKGEDGWDMQGRLMRPPGDGGDRPLPMITLIHGGPTSAHGNVYHAGSGRDFSQLLAAAGFAVFLPNPRGSTGWGMEFSESNLGDQGGKDWQDVQLGVDHCIDHGIADPERLGVAGGSYGGFMTAWSVTQTDRFKAAVMSAGISDWRSFHGMTGIHTWDWIFYNRPDPWDPDGIYRHFSPITHIKNAKTPTLIVHGEEDQVCPVEQAYQFHRGLKDHGVPVELVVYPREPHGLREIAHIRDVQSRTVEWLVKYMEP